MRYTVVLGLILAALTGCSAVDELPPPGAHGEAVVQLWEPAGGAPMTVRTASIAQASGGDFGHLVLKPVQIRVENTDGVLFVTCDQGRFRREATDTLVLESAVAGGLVRLAGAWAGEPFVGVSPHATFRQTERLLAMDEVELVYRGRAEHFLDRPKPVGQPLEGTLTELDHIPAVLFLSNQNALKTGPNRDGSAPALVAALAALPHPLALPPVPRGERH